MKKIFVLLVVVAMMSISAFAQKISADKVPEAVKSAFKAKFPTATKVNWGMENTTEFEAEFKLDGEELSANFDNTGKWLETETEIKVTDLPYEIKTALAKDFDGYQIKEASKIESAKEGTCYEAEIKKGGETFDVLYTAKGKMLSKTKEEKEKDEKKD